MLHIFYFTPRYKMTTPKRSIGLLPARLIRDFSKPVTRANWREGSRLNAIITRDRWWQDYIYSPATARVEIYPNFSWFNWCFETLILGPPRNRSGRELTGLNEVYLSHDEYWRHRLPWCKTWPASDDLSWCTGPHHTTLPEWVIAEFTASPNPTLC
jgi:hypothetical protein